MRTICWIVKEAPRFPVTITDVAIPITSAVKIFIFFKRIIIFLTFALSPFVIKEFSAILQAR